MTMAPTMIQIRRTGRREDATMRSATDKATYIASTATPTDKTTNGKIVGRPIRCDVRKSSLRKREDGRDCL